MKLDELAFVNRQLAGMLNSGIPLEGALKQLCKEMQRSPLKSELEALESDISKGTPLKDALKTRKLPELYVNLLQVGVASNRLPETLVMIADHYEREDVLWTRLKGLMTYPLIVLGCSLILMMALSIILSQLKKDYLYEILQGGNVSLAFFSWLPIVAIFFIFILILTVNYIPLFRYQVFWRIPVFKDASLSRLASSISLMLRNGNTLHQAITLLINLQRQHPIARDLERWQAKLSQGNFKFAELAIPSTHVPTLFIWLVANSGENIAIGFDQAATIYRNRAMHRSEMVLYVILPLSVILLGIVVLCIFVPFFGSLIDIIRVLSNEASGF
jgi:type IV pilus assembly protein PilC